MISWVKTTVDLLMVVGVNRRTSSGWRPNWSDRSDMKRMALGDRPAVVGGCDDEVHEAMDVRQVQDHHVHPASEQVPARRLLPVLL